MPVRSPASPPAPQVDIEVRSLAVRDSLAQLTAMLHRAYASLAAAGMNVSAATQDEDMTRQRTLEGQCMVALLDGRIVGTITVSTPLDTLSGVRSVQFPLYSDPNTGHFHQFAVDPDMRGTGIGTALLQQAERSARGRGYRSMAVDAPGPALELVSFFRHHGYQVVDDLQWPGKSYRSVVMRKMLDRSPLQEHVRTLARHARWACGRMLAVLQAVSETDHRRDLGLQHRSIHGTLSHLLAIERHFWWPRIVDGRSPAASDDEAPIDDRTALAHAVLGIRDDWVELLDSWPDDRLQGELSFNRANGEPIVLPLALLMAHVFDHATMHRGELVSALIRLGQTPPEIGLAAMLLEGSPP